MGFGTEFTKQLTETALDKTGAFDNDPNYGMTVKYNGQEYKYSRNDMKRLSRAYKSMLDNDTDFHDKAYASYTESNFDKQMASKGLPSWKMWGQVEKYASGGGIDDNYSNLSDDDWTQINELWKRDWEYGLTDADATRKALGLAPVAYDEMYENTWLDNELKAKGLPPSKLLNGKLGESYNTWIDNTEKRNSLLQEVTKTYLENTDIDPKKLADMDAMSQAAALFGAKTYTFENAYQDTLAKPEWGSFVNEHQGKIKTLPNQYDSKYLLTDEYGYPLKDENGQDMYDTEKWESDYRAAIANNSKVYDDEFSITLDNAQEWYKENATYVQAQIKTDRYFEAQGKQVSSVPADEYVEMYNDMLTGLSFNDGKPLTVEDFFKDYELTPEIRAEYQPIVDETNRLLRTEGYTAAYNYLTDTENARKKSYNALLTKANMVYSSMSGALNETEEKAFNVNFDSMKAKNPTLAAMITDGLAYGEENMSKTKIALDAAVATGDKQAIETARQDYAKATAEYYKTKAYVNAPESIWKYLEMSDGEFEDIALKESLYVNEFGESTDEDFNEAYNEWYEIYSRYPDSITAEEELLGENEDRLAYQEWYGAYSVADEWINSKKSRDEWNKRWENLSEAEKNEMRGNLDKDFVSPEWISLAKQYRNATEEYYDAIYWNQFDTDAELANKLKSNISVPETGNRDERLKPFVGKEYDATAYDKEHGTSDSKYAVLVNEYSFINGDSTSDYNIESAAKAWEASKSPVSHAAKETQRSDKFIDKVCEAKGITGRKEKNQYKDSMYLAYFMTDAERARFNSLYETEGAAKADEYFEYLRNGPLANRAFKEINEIYADAANSGRLTQEFASVLTVPVNLVYGAVGPLDTLINGTDDTVTEMLRAGKWNSAQKMRGAIAEDRGEIEGFFYQSGMSMADSLAAMAMATGLGRTGATKWLVKGAQWLGTGLLGGSAFNSAYDEGLSRGLSPDKARLTAAGQGFNEMLFEYISMDKLVDIATGNGINVFAKAKPEFLAKMTASKWGRFAMGAANVGVNAGVQGLVEGSEELFTSMANHAWDNAINKSMSEEAQRIIQLMDEGMSYEDAKNQAISEYSESLGMDMLGGMLSGFIMAGGAGALNLATNSSKNDPYGVGKLFTEVDSISAVKVEDALKYAKNNAILDENKTITLEGARKVFNGLLEQGADNVVLSAVRNQLFKTNNTEANNYMDSVIRETRIRDYNALAGSVENYLKKNGANVSRFNARSIVDKYMNAMSDVVQKSDVALLQQNIDLMKRGFVGTVDTLVNGNKGGVSAGATNIANWVASLSEADQAVVSGIAEKYVNTFKSAGLDGAQYSNYANMAAALVYATQQNDFLGNANTAFGLEASVLNEAVNNALLDADPKKAVEFVDNVCQAISVFENAERNGFLDTMSNGMNSLAYCSSLMAQARNHMQNSPSNAVYRFINKFGCSESALSLLAVTNHFDELGAASQNFMRLLAMSKTGLVSFAEFKKASAEMNRANTELKNKQKSYNAQNAAVQAMVESASARAARYEAESNAVRTEVVVDENGNEALAPTADLANATADIDNEQIHTMSQLDIDIENGRRSLNSAQNDLNNAQTKFNEAKATYNDMLNRFCASYMQTLGAQIATMQAGDSLYQSEFDRMTAFAQNGTREDVNRIESIIKNAEKSAAHAFSAASGIDVEIIKFDRKFCEKHKVDGTKEACEIDGKLYINERFMDGSVGYIDQIIAHELGHVAEKSANYYDKFAAFAKKYYVSKFGNDTVKAILDKWVADGMTQEQANHELVAEFCRNQMLSDPTAIITLCKKAPVMSVRVMQWLADTKSRLNSTGLRNSGIAKNVDRALRVYAKALKEAKVTISDMQTTALLENAREAIAQAQEFKEKQAESETKPAETKTAPAQTETQTQTQEQTEAPAQTEAVAEEKAETEQPKKAKSLQEAFDDFMAWSDQALDKLVGQVEETIDEEDAGIDEAAVDEAVAEAVEEELAQESVEESAEEAQPTEQLNETPQTEEVAENPANETPALPFELTDEAKAEIEREVNREKAKAKNGAVEHWQNMSIMFGVKKAVNDLAQKLGVEVDPATVEAFAQQYMLPEQENQPAFKTKKTETRKMSVSELREITGVKSKNANYYTEANTLREGISKLSNNERIAYGQPTISITRDGITVTRLMSANGFSTNNVTADGKRNIATIAKSDFFTNGKETFFRQNLQMKDYKAVVIPNGEDYTTLRAQAREAGVNVISYDETKPHEFENAQRLANEADNVNYYPSKGNSFNDLIQKYGAIPEGMIPRRTDRQVPQRTKDTNRVSQMTRTIAEAPVTSDATYQRMPEWLEKGSGTFVPTSNKKTLEDARGIVSRSGSLKQAAAALHSDVSNGVGRNTDLLARAEIIFQAMQSDNTLTDLEREHVFSDLCIIASDSGRALQLSSELKRMTPEGHIDYIEQVGKRTAERYHKRTGKQIDLSLTKEEKDAYKHATTPEQRGAIDKEVTKRWGEMTSKLTFAEKLRNWRYFSMLGNPRTHLRNIVGNTLMVPVTRIKDQIETLYQMRWDDADKTTTFWTNVNDDVKDYVSKQLKENLPKMQNVSSKYVENIAKNADTQTKDITEMNIREKIKNAWDEENPSTRITNGRFKAGRALNKLSAFNSNMLEVEDAVFLGIRFKSSMYQQIQAKGIDVNNITEAQQRQIVDYAMEEALRATFRDASALADALNKLARSGKIANFAVEAILPFRKTPINIAKRGVEYSPIGFLLSGYKAASNKVNYNNEIKQINAMNITDEQKEAKRQQALAEYKKERLTQIDRLAAGTTGSIAYIFGMFAASLGWISIGRKDDDSSAFETALGKNNYSLNIGDVSIDLSAFSPAAISLLMGCATYQAIWDRRDDDGTPIASTIINVLCESIDPITEMSFLSGFVETVLSGNSYAKYSDGGNTKKLSTIGGQAIESFVGQFIPTFFGQFARFADTKDRSYSAGNDYWASKAFGPEVGSAVKSLQNKLPFLSWLSEPKVDLHGNESGKTNFGEWVLSFANNFILPATIKVDKKNEIDDELVRLYGVIDSSDIFPTKPSRSVGQYQSQSLKIDDDKEYAEYQKEYGQTVYDMLEDLIYGGSYQYMTEAEKADAVEKVIEKAKSITKKRWKAKLIERIK